MESQVLFPESGSYLSLISLNFCQQWQDTIHFSDVWNQSTSQIKTFLKHLLKRTILSPELLLLWVRFALTAISAVLRSQHVGSLLYLLQHPNADVQEQKGVSLQRPTLAQEELTLMMMDLKGVRGHIKSSLLIYNLKKINVMFSVEDKKLHMPIKILILCTYCSIQYSRWCSAG